MEELRNDFAIDALVLEVDRRKGQKECGRYSYGQLIADTTEAERQVIADRYRMGGKRGVMSGGTYKETDDDQDLKKATRALGV